MFKLADVPSEMRKC